MNEVYYGSAGVEDLIKEDNAHFNSKAREWVGKQIDTVDGQAIVSEYVGSREVYLTWEDGYRSRTDLGSLVNNELQVSIVKYNKFESLKLRGSYLSSCGNVLQVTEDLGIYSVFVQSENGHIFKTTRKSLLASKTRLVAECYIGCVFESNTHGKLKVVSVVDQKNVVIEWIATGTIATGRLSHVKAGSVKDEAISNTGFGKLDTRELEGVYTKEVLNKCINLWRGITSRVGNAGGRTPSYTNVTCDKSVTDFSVFVKHVTSLKGFGTEGFELEKDLMSYHLNINPPIYSEKTMIFLPKVLNNLIKVRKHGSGICKPYSGGKWRVYFKSEYHGGFSSEQCAKAYYEGLLESEVKRVAEDYKKDLSENVFNILMSWEVSYE